jgi:hypothetical protein
MGGYLKRDGLIRSTLIKLPSALACQQTPSRRTPFTIELFKGAKRKITMVNEIFHLQGSHKNRFHNCGGWGAPLPGVMVKIEVIRQRFANHGATCFAALLAMTQQSLPMPSPQI